VSRCRPLEGIQSCISLYVLTEQDHSCTCLLSHPPKRPGHSSDKFAAMICWILPDRPLADADAQHMHRPSSDGNWRDDMRKQPGSADTTAGHTERLGPRVIESLREREGQT
jgi:hypothetical protein